jgi:beta-lactamase class C
MVCNPLKKFLLLLLFLFALTISSNAADALDKAGAAETVDKIIRPVLQADNIPGMAIAVAIDGKSFFFNYGVASRDTLQPVTSETLFEIGSISKTFTATLAAFAQINGNLSLSESVSKYLPTLRGSSFDEISLLNLGTHTSGGLPLQVPETIKNTDDLMDYLKHWRPVQDAGTHRTYSNVGIGLLGLITAKSMHQPFEDAMEKELFPALGMTHSYIRVPADQMNRYAQGYTREDKPIRVSPGVLASEAYGIKSCTSDMIRFVIANMEPASLGSGEKDQRLQQAINDTHTGYFTVAEMTQDLIWEQYPWPVELRRVLAGNSYTMITQVASKLDKPLLPQANALIHKTGSTNGFAGYVAFIPAKKMGIVILANKNYDIDERVKAAYEILTELETRSASTDR